VKIFCPARANCLIYIHIYKQKCNRAAKDVSMMFRRKASYPAVAGLLLSCCSAIYIAPLRAQPTLSETDYFATDLPIVLSASRLRQTASDAPVAITVIDREMIEASGFTEIPDLLRLVPGFFVEYDSGHIQAAGYHMLANRYVRQQQILIDGRSVYSPSFGGVPWTDLPITLDDIERIEVIRGPNAVTFGSNSFLGVINIITRPAALDRGTSIKTNIGANHLREAFLRHGDTSGNLDYRINVAYRGDDGFNDRYDSKIVRLFNTRMDYQFDKHQQFSFQAGYNEGPREEDNAISADTPQHLRTVTSQFQQLRWENVTSADEVFHVQLYHNFIQENNAYTVVYDLPPPLPFVYDEGTRSERFDIELQKTNRASAALRYVYGLSYRLDRVTSAFYFGTAEPLEARYTRLFGQLEYQLSNNQLVNLGLMAEDNSITDTTYSPRLAYNFRFADNDTLRMTLSKATRTPLLLEEYPDNKILTPLYVQGLYDNGIKLNNERVTAYDVGLIGSRSNNALHYDIRLFYEDIKGLISTQSISPFPAVNNEAFYFDNFDDALIRGGEIQLDWRPNHQARLHAGVSHIEIDSSNNRGDYTHAAPVNSLTFLGTYRFAVGYQASLGIYQRSSMAPLALKSGDPLLMPAFTRIDTRLAKDFRINQQRHSVAIIVQNILDDTYFSRLNNVIDRRTYLSYKIEF